MAVKGRQQHSRAPRKTGSSSTLVLSFLIILSLFIVILLSLGILSIPGGTKGSPKAHDLSSIAHNSRHSGDEDEDNKDQWVEVISWEPRAFVYHNFLNYIADLNYSHVIEGIYLSPQYHDEGGEISLSIIDQDKIEQVMSKEECDYLISIAEPHMLKSSVVDSETGKSKDSRVRTSSGTFLTRGRDKIVRDIEKRIADFSFIPVEHGEGLQILHYEVGQKYEPHYDYFMDEFNTKNGGQRIATVLMYLSDVEEGGETVFPAAKGNVSSVPWWNELSECAKGGLSVKPRRGDALLFWSMTPDGTLDPSSLHGGCPVIKGNKWSSTKWMRVHEYKV